MCIKVLNKHHLTKEEVVETLIISHKYRQGRCLRNRVKYHSQDKWQNMHHHGVPLTLVRVLFFSSTEPHPKGSKNNIYFLPQTKWCKPLPNWWPSVLRNKERYHPHKRGLGDNSYKGLSNGSSEKHCESLALIF